LRVTVVKFRVTWLTGVDRFADDIASMIGFRPGIYWRICWKFIAPCFLLVISLFLRQLPTEDSTCTTYSNE